MIEKIAYHLGISSDEPNIALAKLLAECEDAKGIREIAAGLYDPVARIASCCIKVLYEIGYLKPALIALYADDFLKLLRSRNNRLSWGAMIALGCIAPYQADMIYASIETVMRAYEKGSVITVDNAVSVFAGLSQADKKYEKALFPVILKHLRECKPKEVAQHAERAFAAVNEKNAASFKAVLDERLGDLGGAQIKRTEKLLKKIEAGRYA
jgi:hypothetical protein